MDLIASGSQDFLHHLCIFDEDLNQDLVCFGSEYPKSTLLQYMDGLLAAKDKEAV